MKKLLIGTTALVAVGMAADGAFAAEKIKLGLGGYWRGFFVVGDQPDVSNRADHGISREGEIYFKGETTLDNGLRASAMVQLEAETSADQIDNSYITFAGNFGMVRVGSFWGPGVAMQYAGVGDQLSGWGNFASHDVTTAPGSNAAGNGFATYLYLAGNKDSIAYYSPRIGGVQVGVSYAPNAQEEKTTALPADNTGAISQMWQAGINYRGKFNDVGVNLAAVYETGNRELGSSSSGNPDGIAFGGNVTFSGFTVGASYKKTDPDSTSVDPVTWEVGANYRTGALKVGLSWAREDADTSDNDELTYIALTGNYALGPGVSLQAGIQDYSWDSDTAADDGDATVFIIGTKLDF